MPFASGQYLQALFLMIGFLQEKRNARWNIEKHQTSSG